jgi:hypothetical protein
MDDEDGIGGVTWGFYLRVFTSDEFRGIS